MHPAAACNAASSPSGRFPVRAGGTSVSLRFGIGEDAALFQQVGQRALQDARRHFGVVEGEVEQRAFVYGLVAAFDEAKSRQLRESELDACLAAQQLAVVLQQDVLG